VPLQDLRSREILRLFASCLDELKRRGVTRSTNNPVADYSELLFKDALDLTLCSKSTKGHDALDSIGRKYEIKGRRLTAHNASRQLSAIRGLDLKHFDFLAGVLFAPDFAVQRACLVPHDAVVACSAYRKHTNSWILHLRDSLWTLAGVIDVTDALIKVQNGYDA
jgi:hypothetical protein